MFMTAAAVLYLLTHYHRRTPNVSAGIDAVSNACAATTSAATVMECFITPEKACQHYRARAWCDYTGCNGRFSARLPLGAGDYSSVIN